MYRAILTAGIRAGRVADISSLFFSGNAEAGRPYHVRPGLYCLPIAHRQVASVCRLMQAGGMLKAPLNVAPLAEPVSRRRHRGRIWAAVGHKVSPAGRGTA